MLTEGSWECPLRSLYVDCYVGLAPQNPLKRVLLGNSVPRDTLGVPSASACLCPQPAEAACPGTSLASIHTANKEADAMVDCVPFLPNGCPALLSIQTRGTAAACSLVAQRASDRHGTTVTPLSASKPARQVSNFWRRTWATWPWQILPLWTKSLSLPHKAPSSRTPTVLKCLFLYFFLCLLKVKLIRQVVTECAFGKLHCLG